MPRPNELRKVGDLFEKYRKLLKPPQQSVAREVREVIRDLLGFELDERSITYTVGSKTVALHVPSTLKHEILLHREELLAHLTGRLGEAHAPKTIL